MGYFLSLRKNLGRKSSLNIILVKVCMIRLILISDCQKIFRFVRISIFFYFSFCCVRLIKKFSVQIELSGSFEADKKSLIRTIELKTMEFFKHQSIKSI